MIFDSLFKKSKKTLATDENAVLVIGLGNPGSRYVGTRHNMGFMVADYLQSHGDFTHWKREKNYEIATGTVNGTKVILIKPQTYMNKSGEALEVACVDGNGWDHHAGQGGLDGRYTQMIQKRSWLYKMILISSWEKFAYNKTEDRVATRVLSRSGNTTRVILTVSKLV